MFNLALISFRTRAVVRSTEMYQSAAAVRQALNRGPDLVENGLVSWGNVSLQELQGLMLHSDDPDPEGFETLSRWNTQYGGEEYFWSLYFEEKEYV